MKSIEELSEKETIEKCVDRLLLDQTNAVYQQNGDRSEYYFTRRDKTKAEILSRFSELKKEEEKQRLKKEYYHEEHAKELIKRVELEKENERLKNDGWVKRVYQLEHQLEDMKCCGNCKHSDTDWDKKVVCCLVEEKETKAYKYCDNWQSDGLTAKDRKE